MYKCSRKRLSQHLTQRVNRQVAVTCTFFHLHQDCPTYDTRTQNGTRKGFFGTSHSLLSYIFNLPFPNSFSKLWRTCLYMHISNCVQTAYELPLLPNNTAEEHFYTNRSVAKCWQDIYRWGTGLAVTGPIRDIARIVLQSWTGSSSSQVTANCFLYRVPQGGLYKEYDIITTLH